MATTAWVIVLHACVQQWPHQGDGVSIYPYNLLKCHQYFSCDKVDVSLQRVRDIKRYLHQSDISSMLVISVSKKTLKVRLRATDGGNEKIGNSLRSRERKQTQA